MPKTFIYRSTYNIPFDKWQYTMDDAPRAMFQKLWMAGEFSRLIRSAYFQVMRIGDGKYTLNVQKTHDVWCAKFTYNENYPNKMNFYTD